MSTHVHSTGPYRHEHVFLGEHHARNERKTWAEILLCSAMMLLEIGGGALFGSMALIADGMHMSTHAAALLIAALAYLYARRHAGDRRFAFGTGKFGELAAYSSALILALIALGIGAESVSRLVEPVPIRFSEALPLAGLGLGVNLLSAWLLRDDHSHAHDRDGGSHRHDLNMRAAYTHVLADAAVSLLAIVGLSAGLWLGWSFMDPLMGIIGAAVVANWSLQLLRAAGGVLLDMSASETLAARVRQSLEQGPDRVSDLHLWRLGPGHNAVIATVVTENPVPASALKTRLSDVEGLSHVTIEVEVCHDRHPA
ncbi:MAG: CDF family Co(II)/Ni(II) efflux transporter DmeF [Alphaproteobacteria bacterium]|nr:CDF family Co(II)/Ni(II) efflux transporter DmeF [Alphaproteobacteria bacterium]